MIGLKEVGLGKDRRMVWFGQKGKKGGVLIVCL